MFKTIKSKFTFIYSSYAVISIFLLLGTIYLKEHKRLFKLEIDHSQEISDLNAQIIGTIFDKNISFLNNLTKEIKAENMSEKEILKELKCLVQLNGLEYVNAAYIKINGDMIDIFDNRSYVGDMEEFKFVRDRGLNQFVISPVLESELKESVINVGVTIKSDENLIESGLLVSIKLSVLTEALKGLNANKSSYAWIVDQSSLIISHPIEEYSLKLNMKEADKLGYLGSSKIADKISESENGYYEYYDENINQKKIMTFSTIPNTNGWKLLITTIKSDVFKDVNVILIKVLIAGILIILFFIGLIFKLTDSIIKPIKKLTNSVKNSMGKDFEPIELELENEDEIAELIFAYNEMTVAISIYTEELENLVAERTEELDNLNDQLSRLNKKLSKENKELYGKATKDTLTGLFNREELTIYLKYLISELENETLIECSLLFMDLDNFKFYNDTFGHDVGDKILKLIAKNFRTHMREKDFVARYGGDEFVAILPKVSSENAENIKNTLLNSIENLNGFRGQIADWLNLDTVTIPSEKSLGVSIGIYTFSKDTIDSAENILIYADKNMYEEKKKRKSRNLVK